MRCLGRSLTVAVLNAQYPLNRDGEGVGSDLRQDRDSRVGNVVLQIPRLLPFERGGIVNLNFKTGAVDVQLLAVARHAETEARTARNLGLLRQSIAA